MLFIFSHDSHIDYMRTSGESELSLILFCFIAGWGECHHSDPAMWFYPSDILIKGISFNYFSLKIATGISILSRITHTRALLLI